MFGYVVADQGGLAPEQLERYRQVYCGLCRSLRENHGQLSRLGLTYDMTFLVLLLDALYEPRLNHGENRCPPHPLSPRSWRRSQWSDYGADVNVVLAYYKCMDDWQDDRSLPAVTYGKLLETHARQVEQRWPAQCEAVRTSLAELSALEQAKSADLDGTCRSFGRLMGALFAVGDPFWAKTLYELGDYLGRFIYVLDAVLDEEEDTKKGRYNPVTAFRAKYGSFDEKTVLTLLIGSCAAAYEKLPIVEDKDLLDNILYHGVWGAWTVRQKQNEDKHSTEQEQKETTT